MMTGEVLRNFTWHANYRGEPGGSEFMGRLAETLIAVLNLNSSFGRRILSWGDTAHADALCLRACAALHALARTGVVVELSAVYPPAEPSDAQLAAAVRAAIEDADSFLTSFLDSPPQTNEAARSAILLGGALHLARRFGHPLALYEIGASAGLNLRMAHYAYDLGGGHRWGRADAPLTIRCAWRGNLPPLDAPMGVLGAAGCDVAPLDPDDDNDAGRLISYVWADQPERIARIEAAILNARNDGIRVVRADAAEWVEALASGPAPSGITRLMFHTIVSQYLPEATKGRIATAMAEAGARATAESPLAWFRFENDGEKNSGRIDMTVWPGGEDTMLGRADFHGRWVEWA